jgi:hypothetical protein
MEELSLHWFDRFGFCPRQGLPAGGVELLARKIQAVEIRSNSQSGRFDGQHLNIVRREIARSVKPNLLRDLEDKELDDSQFLLLLEDLVDLSPDAKELLKQMRRERRGKGKKQKEKDPDFLSLLAGLEDLRKQVEENDAEEPLLQQKPKPRPFFPPMIALSTHVPRTEPLPPRSASAAPLDEAGQLVRRMVAISPRHELSDQVARELQVFGSQIVAPMKQFGIRIIVLERTKTLDEIKIGNMHVVAPSERTFDGRLWSTVRGLYDNSRRLLVVGEELVGLSNRSTARHEFAHAYDHFISERGQRRMPLSVQLWNSFRDARGGLISAYAGTNPAEYWAESVEAFFQADGREVLRNRDPQMHDYLVTLFVA